LTALKAATADAKAVFTERTAATTFDLIRGPLESLREFLSPFLWLEGERTREQTFGGVAPDPSASQGAYLVLNSSRDPRGGVYVARYTVNVNTSGLYELWLAGSPPGQEGASPVRWEIAAAQQAAGSDPPAGAPARPATSDGGGEAGPVSPSISRPGTLTPGPAYAPGLAWTRLGSVRLDPGRYVLTLSVAERGGERFLFRVDSLLLAREPFTPNGIQKPVWRALKASQ
jgi:hypothetical protein